MTRLRVLACIVVIQAILVAALTFWNGAFAVVMAVVFVISDILGAIPLRPRRWPVPPAGSEDP